jgi:hypothetical protein
MLLKTLIDSFVGETPIKAKRVRTLSISIILVAGSIWGAQKLGVLPVPETLLIACQYITIIGAALGVGAQSQSVKKTK